jgi:hypothetical protein
LPLPLVLCHQIWELVARNSRSLLDLMLVSKHWARYSRDFLHISIQYALKHKRSFSGSIPFTFPVKDFVTRSTVKRLIRADVNCTFVFVDTPSDGLNSCGVLFTSNKFSGTKFNKKNSQLSQIEMKLRNVFLIFRA